MHVQVHLKRREERQTNAHTAYFLMPLGYSLYETIQLNCVLDIVESKPFQNVQRSISDKLMQKSALFIVYYDW